jgi:hypothetical protein
VAGTNVQYFWQAHDGRLIFLHPFSAKLLLHNGKWCSPEDLTVPILAIEAHTVSEELRKRHSCLKHLPMSSSFIFCEVDLTGICSEETMEHFGEELKKRAKQRKAAEQRLRREEERKAGAVEDPLASYWREAQACGVEMRFTEEAPDMDEASSFPSLEGLGLTYPKGDSSQQSPLLESEGAMGPSFASLTRNGFAAAGPDYRGDPQLGAGATKSPSQGMWGASAAPSAILLPGSSGMARSSAAGRVASFGGQDEDDVPAEFRYAGGTTGLGDFLVLKGGAKSKQKGKKKKKAAAGEDMDMAFFES